MTDLQLRRNGGIKSGWQDLQTLQIDFLDVGGRGLEDDLELGVPIKAVGILGIPTVCRSTRGLDVGNGIGLGTQHPEEGLGVHRSGPYLDIVGLLDDAAVFHPETQQLVNDFLKRLHLWSIEWVNPRDPPDMNIGGLRSQPSKGTGLSELLKGRPQPDAG